VDLNTGYQTLRFGYSNGPVNIGGVWSSTGSSGEEQSLRNLLSVRSGRGETFPLLLVSVYIV
jgi:hypothetical protein